MNKKAKKYSGKHEEWLMGRIAESHVKKIKEEATPHKGLKIKEAPIGGGNRYTLNKAK